MAQDQDATTVDEIVVTGAPIRDSLARALQVQRNADNIVNVIAADTVGRFPDATAAQALARLPGIATQRDQGQERFIQVRGAPARWTAVSFDGVNVLGADERVFRFDSVPTSLIEQVDVNKTLTADQPAEALAGRVNIHTFSALANPGFEGQVEAGFGYVDLGDGPVTRLGARLSYGGDTWGFVVGASAFKFEQRTDNAEPRYDAVGVTEQRNAKYVIERETNAYLGKIEYRPSADHEFSFTSLLTEFLDDEERNQYTFYFREGSTSTSRAVSGTRNFTSADLVGVGVQAAYQKGNYENSTFHNVLHGRHNVGAWRGNWDLGYTQTESSTYLPIPVGLIGNPANRPSVNLSVGPDQGAFVIRVFDTVQTGAVFSRGAALPAFDQTAFDTQLIAVAGTKIETEAYVARGEIERDWSNLGAQATFKAGFQFDDRTATDPGSLAFFLPNGTASTTLTVRAPGTTPLNLPGVLGVPLDINASVSGAALDDAFQRGYNANYIDNQTLGRQFAAFVAAARTQGVADLREDPALANSVDETIAAGFVQNRWDWDRHVLVAGVRVEQTEVTSDGVATVGTVRSPISITQEDTLFFPSVHYTFDARDDLKLRVAYVSGASRPDFVDQRATVTINDAARTVTGGNPRLKPEEATGFDLSAEWYFAPAALLSVSAFHRDVQDVLFASTDIVAAGEFAFDGVNRTGYTLSSVQNGGDGELRGVEFAYYHPLTFLPGVLSGFGVQGSIAFLEGEFEGPGGRAAAFPGTSDRVTSASIFYENYGASVRLSWTDRTDWLDELSPGAATDIFWDDTQRLELSARYQITDRVTAYMDVNNLTDELGRRYQGRSDRAYEVEGFGRRFLFGLRANF